MKLINLNTGRVLAWEMKEAGNFLKRLRGLLFTASLPAGSALHISPCRSVHTFLMKYAIDVVHLDAGRRIVGIEHELMPGSVGKRFSGTVSVVELPAGTVKATDTNIGQVLDIQRLQEAVI